MNIVLLAGGKSRFKVEGDEQYPICLTEIDGEPLINHILSSTSTIDNANLICIIRRSFVDKYHLDNALKQTIKDTKIIVLDSDTMGAACSALMAVDYIDNDEELLLMSADEYVSIELGDIISSFKEHNGDAGTVIFESVHPRYSFVKIDEKNEVLEAAEKNPISNNATAGIYWFKHGHNFIEGAMNSIRKDSSVMDNFYICPVFNELILKQMKVIAHKIDKSLYHPIKSKRQLEKI